MSKRSAPKEKASPRKRVVEGDETLDQVLMIRLDDSGRSSPPHRGTA